MTLPSDPTLLCREAEDWAALLDEEADDARRYTALPAVCLSPAQADALSRLLSQLATLARAQACRT